MLEGSKELVKLVGRRSCHLCDALNACNSLAELPDLAPLLPDAVALEAELGQLAGAEPGPDPAEEDTDE